MDLLFYLNDEKQRSTLVKLPEGKGKKIMTESEKKPIYPIEYFTINEERANLLYLPFPFNLLSYYLSIYLSVLSETSSE